MLLPIETKPFSIAELHCSNIISYCLSITTFTIYHQHVQRHLIISCFHAILETINYKAPDCHGADPPARPTSMRKSVLAGWGLAPFKGLRNEMTRHGGHGLWMSIFPRLGHFHEKTLFDGWFDAWCIHPQCMSTPQSGWHATVHIDSKTILNLCWMHKGISLLFNHSVPLQFLICWCYSSIWYIDHPRPRREASTTAPNQAQRSRKPEALNHTSGTELPSAWRLIGQWTNREHGMNASLFEMCI